MQLSFRAKLLSIVASATAAFVLVILVSTLIGLGEATRLADVERRLLPKLEVGPQIDAAYQRLRRALQDSVAAQDLDELNQTRNQHGHLTRQIGGARAVLDPGQADGLLDLLDIYYQTAYDVSRRLIAGESGEGLVSAVADMQAKQARLEAALESAIRLDRGELTTSFEAIRQSRQEAGRWRLAIGIAALGLVLLLSFTFSRGMLETLREISVGIARFGRGDFTRPIPIAGTDELGRLATDANQMAQSLEKLHGERDITDWIKTGQAGLAQALRGELEPAEAAERAVLFLTSYLGAPAGAIYFMVDGGRLNLLGRSAQFTGAAAPPPQFEPGEGLVGQAALQPDIVEVSALPIEYPRVRSGLGEGTARSVLLIPLVNAGRVRGVLELLTFAPWSASARELLASVRETMVIAIEGALARAATRDLLAETQRQAQRLGAQEQELRANNEELQAQQEEMRQINEELDHQRSTLEEQNRLLGDAQRGLEEKAAELLTVSAYKSRFLANMSHELRTPLNSMLILSELLANNESKNLTDKQVEFCKTINSAGRDLLALINQVLDLSKIEAGKQQVHLEDVEIAEIAGHMRRIFEPLATDKHLAYTVEVAPGVPDNIRTDRQRIDQVLTNLLGNAIKFTTAGRVELRICPSQPDTRLRRQDLALELAAGRCLAFSVTDTGVGIAEKDLELVFNPFERLETKTDRRYGSTGLGLTIARELVALLGGELQVQSTLGQGSVFTIHLPFSAPAETNTGGRAEPLSVPTLRLHPPEPRSVEDDRSNLAPGKSALLLIEDDSRFAESLVELIHQRGFKVIWAPSGEEGFELAHRFRPSGIVLDVKLPDVSGFTVMDRLRRDPLTAAIPVHFLSAVDGADRGRALGAIGYLTKPATTRELSAMLHTLAPAAARKARKILVVGSNHQGDDSVLALLAADGLEATVAGSPGEAFATLARENFACLILDLALSVMDGLGFLEDLAARTDIERPPVVVYTGRALTRDETKRLEAYAEAVVLKEGRSSERLLEEVRLFIHHLAGRLPRGKERPLKPEPGEAGRSLAGKRLLVVDDDMRTVYALSALLRNKGMEVLTADTGVAALEALAHLDVAPERAARPRSGGDDPISDIDAIIMDVMMPEMDGYEAMRRIRALERWRELPIIALTAKAMKGEREKCLEAGASDYLSKPIDNGELMARLRVWLLGRGPTPAEHGD